MGEVRKGRVKLEEYVVRLARAAGLSCFAVLINSQRFTKTDNNWGITNNAKGANSNKVVLLQSPNRKTRACAVSPNKQNVLSRLIARIP